MNKKSKSMPTKTVPFSKSLKTFNKFLTSSVGILYVTHAPKYSTSIALENNPMM